MRRIAWIIGLILLVAAGGWWLHQRGWSLRGAGTEASSGASQGAPAGGRTGRAGPPGGALPVVAGTVAKKDVPIYLDGLGTVQAFNTVTVRARVDGELQKIAFREGQDVKAGDLLAQIDARPYQAALDQAAAKKAQDEAQLANAKRDLERYSNLRKEGNYATQQQLDTQRAQVDQLEAVLKSDQAAIDSARVQLGYTTILAPINGRIGIRQIDQGNIVHASDANGLVVITQTQPISVVFTLPEQNLPAIMDASAAGQPAAPALTVVALDRDAQKEIDRGTLSVIDNQIDQTTGTIKMKATFPNEARRLWPGQFVNVRLLLMVRKDGIVVPAQVVQRGPRGAFAYIIKDDRTVEMRPVKVAQIEDGEALIDDGLAPGERVVVDGQSRLQAGSRVTTRTGGDERPAAAANADGSPARTTSGEGGGRRNRADAASETPAGAPPANGGARSRP